MADTTDPSGALPSRVDRKIDLLIDTIAELGARLADLATQVADTTRNVAALTRLMDRHLRFDHGYGDDE